MIKITFCLRRKAGMSAKAFHDYWLNSHGPLVASLQPALGMRRYVQTHAIVTPYDQPIRENRGAPEPFDGIAELWWESLEALAAGFATPEGRRAGRTLLEDERKFIDLARSPLWFNREHVIVGKETPP